MWRHSANRIRREILGHDRDDGLDDFYFVGGGTRVSGVHGELPDVNHLLHQLLFRAWNRAKYDYAEVGNGALRTVVAAIGAFQKTLTPITNRLAPFQFVR